MSAYIAIAVVLPLGDDANQSRPSSNADGVGKCWLDRLGQFLQDGNPIINRRKSANVAALERVDVSGVGTEIRE